MINNNNAFMMARGSGSRIEIHAADAEKESWTQLKKSASAGSSKITVVENTGWQAGDVIAIASTGFDMNEVETRTIQTVSANGRTLTLDAPLTYDHFGKIERHDAGNDIRAIDMRAEVALLSRNVTIQGDEDAESNGYGGHTMIMGGAMMHIDGAELTRMGQAGELGRYPMHFHMLGDASGQYVTNSSIHETYNKGLTIHGTQNTWIEDNVIFDTIGHSYYFEDGSEFGNVLKDNLGMNTRATDSVAAGSIGSDHTAVSTYWVTNPDNHLVGNHAGGSDHVGFWILSQTGVQGISENLPEYATYVPNEQLPGQWRGNASHSNGADGIFIGGEFIETTGERTDFDPGLEQYFHVKDFTTYKNQDFGLWVRNAEGVWTDIAIADSKKGLRMWGSNEIEDGLIIGRSSNEETYGFDSYHGWELYDKATTLDRVHFAGFDGALDTAIANHSGFGRNTNNAVSSLTFGDDVEQRFATRTHTPFLDGLLDFGGSLMGGLHDTDGSLTGRVGAIITPGIIDTQPGERADILEYAFTGINAAGFNWTAGAQWQADGNYWLNPASSVIGRQTFYTSNDESERVDFTITRTDNGASLLYDYATQQFNGSAQLNVDGAMNGEYVVTYPDGLPPTDLAVRVWDLPFGTEVLYRFEDIPARAFVQGAAEVANQAALNASDGSAWFRDADGTVFLKLVADRYLEFPYGAVDDVPVVEDQVYEDFVQIVFDPAPGDSDYGDIRERFAPADFRPNPTPTPLPDRAPSTSSTIAQTGDLPRWSDPATWDGDVPGSGDVVVIGPGQQVVLDVDAEVKGIIVHGADAALVVEDRANTKVDLVADWVLIENGGLFQAGTETDPLDTDFTLTLTGDNPRFDLDVEGYVRGEKRDAVYVAEGGTPDPLAPIGEAGTVKTRQSDKDTWYSVAFETVIEDAVVVMGPVQGSGKQAAVTRVRNVTDMGFEYQIDEWDYLDGRHASEKIGWIALSEGSHELAGGQTIVAGTTEVGTGFETVGFGSTLKAPIVLSEVTSVNEANAVTTRTKSVKKNGFEIRIAEEEAADGVHSGETVSWIAIETGASADLEAIRSRNILTDKSDVFEFVTSFKSAPVLIADLQTYDGRDTAALRFDDLSKTKVSLFVEEEQSFDEETDHTTEVAGILALEDGLIFAG